MKAAILVLSLALVACSRFSDGQTAYVKNGCDEVVIDHTTHTAADGDLITATNMIGQRWKYFPAELVATKDQCWPVVTSPMPPDFNPEWNK